MNLPARLDKVIDDVGVGAIIKNLNDDFLAVVVDTGNTLKVCRYIHEGDNEPTFNVENYDIQEITDNENWIVLTEGYDYDLSD